MASDDEEDRMVFATAQFEAPLLARIITGAAPLAKPVSAIISAVINMAGPLYIGAAPLAIHAYNLLPVDIISAAIGLGLAFCGGAYCASIAAMEAFRLCGWETTKAALLDIRADLQSIWQANAADSKKDDDGDGVPDCQSLAPADLLRRKSSVFLSELLA